MFNILKFVSRVLVAVRQNPARVMVAVEYHRKHKHVTALLSGRIIVGGPGTPNGVPD